MAVKLSETRYLKIGWINKVGTYTVLHDNSNYISQNCVWTGPVVLISNNRILLLGNS